MLLKSDALFTFTPETVDVAKFLEICSSSD